MDFLEGTPPARQTAGSGVLRNPPPHPHDATTDDGSTPSESRLPPPPPPRIKADKRALQREAENPIDLAWSNRHLSWAEPYSSSRLISQHQLQKKNKGDGEGRGPRLERPVQVEHRPRRRHQTAACSQVCDPRVQIPYFLPLLSSCVTTLMTPCSSVHML